MSDHMLLFSTKVAKSVSDAFLSNRRFDDFGLFVKTGVMLKSDDGVKTGVMLKSDDGVKTGVVSKSDDGVLVRMRHFCVIVDRSAGKPL
jgi:hypothetical protein